MLCRSTARLLGVHGYSTVVGVNCGVVGGTVGVVLVAGNIGLGVVFQWRKRVVVVCGPLMDKPCTTDARTQRCVK